jgi:peptidyl-prolyl cis-trans isomerase A (cyclophilin A)
MKYLLYLCMSLALIFTSCEGKKNTSAAPLESASETQNNSEEKKNTLSDSIDSEKNKNLKTYPEITNKNVVEFLTHYGAENPETKVRISTQHGDIDIELFEDTPLHRANFIFLVKQAYFDGSFFHRVVPDFIIQGGNSDNVKTTKKRAAIGNNYLLPAELENGRTHRYGTVSGAKEYRENPDKRTAPFEFFIFLGPQTATGHLNGNYTIFGKVTKGMEVVEKISELPADEGDWPLQNVYIKAEVLR